MSFGISQSQVRGHVFTVTTFASSRDRELSLVSLDFKWRGVERHSLPSKREQFLFRKVAFRKVAFRSEFKV